MAADADVPTGTSSVCEMRLLSVFSAQFNDVPTRQLSRRRFACHGLPGCLVSVTRASIG